MFFYVIAVLYKDITSLIPVWYIECHSRKYKTLIRLESIKIDLNTQKMFVVPHMKLV